eukprot:9467768-Pyramimonas_sp.AAC.1
MGPLRLAVHPAHDERELELLRPPHLGQVRGPARLHSRRHRLLLEIVCIVPGERLQPLPNCRSG